MIIAMSEHGMRIPLTEAQQAALEEIFELGVNVPSDTVQKLTVRLTWFHRAKSSLACAMCGHIHDRAVRCRDAR